MIESIEAVSTDDVRAVASEFLRPERLSLTMLGRLDGLKFERADLEF